MIDIRRSVHRISWLLILLCIKQDLWHLTPSTTCALLLTGLPCTEEFHIVLCTFGQSEHHRFGVDFQRVCLQFFLFRRVWEQAKFPHDKFFWRLCLPSFLQQGAIRATDMFCWIPSKFQRDESKQTSLAAPWNKIGVFLAMQLKTRERIDQAVVHHTNCGNLIEIRRQVDETITRKFVKQNRLQISILFFILIFAAD